PPDPLPLSLHDALPIYGAAELARSRGADCLDMLRPVPERPLLGREVRDRRGDAVISVLGHNRAAAPRGGECEPPRDLVRLAPGVDRKSTRQNSSHVSIS